MKRLASLAELRLLMQTASESRVEQDRVSMLVEHYVEAPELAPPPIDPFCRAYRDWVASVHALVSQRADYSPGKDELIPIEPKSRALRPGIYVDGGSKHLGSFLEAIGQILQVVDTQAGARVVEYGPGDGQLSLALARNGCHVAVVDIEAKHLETIRLQAEAFGISVDCRLGEFIHDHGLREFDVAIFFEAFHHAIDHPQVLDNLYKALKPDGRIIFSGEPIIERGSYWERTVPFPWGLRLDGLSLSAVAHYGWMELGFQEGYFIELLMRYGWLIEKVASPTNARGTCRIARKMPDDLSLGQNFSIEIWDGDAGWHGVESSGRWTKGNASFPLPRGAENVRVTLSNPLPWQKTFEIGPNKQAGTLSPHGGRIDVDVAGCRDRLVINAPVTNLTDLTQGRDTREVGVFLERIVFRR